jgi:hypothetical protein
MKVKCPGSGIYQTLAWPSTIEYPGAGVCIYCSKGVQIVKGSETIGTREGKVKVHYS